MAKYEPVGQFLRKQVVERVGACADDWRSLLVELWLAVEAVLVNVLVDLPA